MSFGSWLRDHPRLLERAYQDTHRLFERLDPLFKRLGYDRAESWLHLPEELGKKVVFDCRMCGQCILHSTGMTCPMTCPKNLRNGPCGGVRQNGNCEVKPEMSCVWVTFPKDARLWAGNKKSPTAGKPPIGGPFSLGHDADERRSRPPLRVGGCLSVNHIGFITRHKMPPEQQQTQTYISGSRLERVLRAGRFAVTAELNPPDSADPQKVYDAALVLSRVCDSINATDASGANCHMSSVAICALLVQAGYEPVMQVSCRDRNRIAIQGDVLAGQTH